MKPERCRVYGFIHRRKYWFNFSISLCNDFNGGTKMTILYNRRYRIRNPDSFYHGVIGTATNIHFVWSGFKRVKRYDLYVSPELTLIDCTADELELVVGEDK